MQNHKPHLAVSMHEKTLNAFLLVYLLAFSALPYDAAYELSAEKLETRNSVSVSTKRQLFASGGLDIPFALSYMFNVSPDKDKNREAATVCSGPWKHFVCPRTFFGNYQSYNQFTLEGSTFAIYCCGKAGFQRCCDLEEFKVFEGDYKMPGWIIGVIVVSVIVGLLLFIGVPICICIACGCGLAMCAKSSTTGGSTIGSGSGGTTGRYGGTTVGYGGTTGGYAGTAGGYTGTAGGYTGTAGGYDGATAGPA